MTYDHSWSTRVSPMDIVHATFLSFPIACFSLAVLTDLAYLQTLNLLWLHFSEWLLFAGLVFGVLAALSLLINFVVRRVRPSGLAILAGIVVLLLAAVNSFVHTADGWTAVMPYGLALSILTVIVMVITAWLGRLRASHVHVREVHHV